MASTSAWRRRTLPESEKSLGCVFGEPWRLESGEVEATEEGAAASFFFLPSLPPSVLLFLGQRCRIFKLSCRRVLGLQLGRLSTFAQFLGSAPSGAALCSQVYKEVPLDAGEHVRDSGGSGHAALESPQRPRHPRCPIDLDQDSVR